MGTEAVDGDALQHWLTGAVPGAAGPLRIEQLAGGSSNLTFRIRDEANDWVLRRPPLSHVLATANDMRREYTVQQALAASDVPVPQVVAFCDDPEVLGAPFYVMERLDGVVYSDADQVAHLTDAESRAASFELVDVLARLHAVRPAEVGLDGFGKPDGFLARQVGRWCTQWERSKAEDNPAIDEVARRLGAHLPAHSDSSIVHGDYSFNNTMFWRDRPAELRAVLDWEMSTLGDPLTDVGMVAVYWGAVGQLLWRERAPQAHRANAGFVDVDTLLERYASSSGRDLTELGFYRTLATFKLAVITAGARARLAAGDPQRAATTSSVVDDLAEAALAASADL